MDKDFDAMNSWLGGLGKVCGFEELAALPERLAVGATQITVGRDDTTELVVCREEDNRESPRDMAMNTADLARNIGPLPGAAPKRQIAFSVSKIDRFRGCPRRCYYGFIAGLPESLEGGFAEKQGGPPGHLTGTVLHYCLELLDAGLPREESFARGLAEKVSARWRTAVAEDASPLLQRYVDSGFQREIGAFPARREWQFAFFLPEAAENSGGYDFTGSVDCIVDYGTEGYGIIDYKTDKDIYEDFNEKF